MSESTYANNLAERVALGLVPGWETFRKFGINDIVTSSTTQEMWPLGTAKIWPTAAGIVSVTSSSIADDGDPAGTGAWTLTIYGLDSNWLEVQETITLNGTTAVTTTQEFYRINRAYVNTAGTAGFNVGNITGTIGGNPQLYVEATEGQTQQTHYTVPADKVVVLKQYRMNSARMAGNTDLHILGQIRLGSGVANEAWRSISDIYLYQSGWFNDDGVTILPSKADIRQVIKSTASTQCSATLAGFLVKTTEFQR
jgi:hypothetical protein